MTTIAAEGVADTDRRWTLERPYRPSTLSGFLDWLAARPMRAFIVIPGIGVGLEAWGLGVLWGTGVVPVGTFPPLLADSIVYGPYILATLVLSNVVAGRSLAAFWPATGWPIEEQAAWRWRFQHVPAGSGLALTGLGAAVAAAATLPAMQVTTDAFGGDPVVALIAALPTVLLGYGLFPLTLRHVVHQLRLVVRIHREATQVDPFDHSALYAFSRLTGFAGFAFLFIGYYSMTVNGVWQAGNFVALATLAVAAITGVLCFVVPLWGIHRRIAEEKERLLRGAEARVAAVADELYRRIDAREFDGTKNVADTFSGVSAARQRILSLPTWPWSPNLFRGFISALLLPVIVYVTSRVVGALFGA